MATGPYDRIALASAVAQSCTWNDLMRRLGLKPSGGQRRVPQQRVAAHGIDTGHFKHRSPWRRYPDAAIAAAAASSTTLREVALKLGATPATGTLAHIRRRIAAAGIDISHFPGIDRPRLDLPFTHDQLRTTAGPAEVCGEQPGSWEFPTTAGHAPPWDGCSENRASTLPTFATPAPRSPRTHCARPCPRP
jgi:hypothetical protein